MSALIGRWLFTALVAGKPFGPRSGFGRPSERKMTTRLTLPPTGFLACAMRSAVAVCIPSAVGVLPFAVIALIFVASPAAVDVHAVGSELAVVPLKVVIPTSFPVGPMPP